MLRAGTMLLFAMVVAGRSATAAVVSSDFSTDVEGWTKTAATVFQQQAAGGNPDGFLFIDNSEGPIELIFAPAKFRGDLSAFDGGTLSFDGNMLGTGGGDFFGPSDYGTVQISGPGGAATLDLVPGIHSGAGGGNPPTNQWTTFSASFDAATWGMSQLQWIALLSNVTEISLSVEALFGAEIQGIDNFKLVTSVPVPATGGLVAIGLTLVGLMAGRAATSRGATGGTRADRPSPDR
jgi:hypothetical protein